jgi:alanine-glyoxylate transaminase / serine-glyoxylate transaminase / serine-pyruvate transaminase
MTLFPALDTPERLLCGPGPTNVSPDVLAAMQRPILGHLDPDLHEILDEVVALQRIVYRAPTGLVFPLQATGMSGMEAGITNLLEPGDVAVVASAGFFGRRIAELARRHGVEVVEVTAGYGEHVPNERVIEAVESNPETRLVAVVHAETSTGVLHPLAELGAELRGRDVLLMADCVTSLAGVELDINGWGVDYAYSCTQKCLAAPPGMSPLAISEAALERIAARRTPPPFSFDLPALQRYWVERPVVYHHTAPILHIYALHEALRQALIEGLEQRWARHEAAASLLRAGLAARGLGILADPNHRLAPLTAVMIPDGIDGKRVQTQMLREHGIEIGGGLGPDAPPIWRIGLMGINATAETVDRVLGALDAVLAQERELSAVG